MVTAIQQSFIVELEVESKPFGYVCELSQSSFGIIWTEILEFNGFRGQESCGQQLAVALPPIGHFDVGNVLQHLRVL